MTGNEMALMASIAVDMQDKEVDEVLDKIRAEIAGIAASDGCGDYLLGFNFGLMRAALIIDKYRSESED